jgi:N-methylhydantoinase A
VQLVLSGPAAGVGALRYFGEDTGARNLVSIEVGGTSCDVTLVHGAAVGMTDQLEIDGYHLAVPSVEIHTIGAGGGTISTVNDAGMLRAGPEGAGARPGPACYGFGGTYPTVTDCHLVLGRLKPGPYAGGAVSLDLELAREAVRQHLAIPLGISLEQAASGVIRLVEQNIQHAVERVSIERGYNPREFTLVAVGGAGALHGVAAAKALGCQSVFVPRLAGVFCAFGMCNTDLRQDHVMSWIADLESDDDPDLANMRAALEGLRQRASETLENEGFAPEDQELQISLDLRYAGQQWTVTVNCETVILRNIKQAFEDAYRQLYGYLQPTGQIQVVNLRVAAIGKLPPAKVRPAMTATSAPQPAATRQVWIDEQAGWADVPIFEGAGLQPGHAIKGPAVIEELTTTILFGAGSQLLVTSADNYLIHLEEAHA